MAQADYVDTVEQEQPVTPDGLKSQLLYDLYDKPPVGEAFFVAIQHVLAAFVGMITPGWLICAALGASPETSGTIVSMSLFASGTCTFIQCRKFGPIGSGLLNLQGTSFAFVVIDSVVMIIGLSLIRTGMFRFAGGAAAVWSETFGSTQNLGLSGLVLAIVVFLTLSINRFLRMGRVLT